MPDILPTGTCFDDAIEYVEKRIKVLPSAKALGLVVAHAICKAESGQLYAHAWAEEAGECWDCGIIDGQKVWYALPWKVYKRVRRVQECTRYSMREVLDRNLASGHYGPWEDKYLALLSQGGEIRIMGKTHIVTRRVVE